jgi:hypothetical protein
MSRHNHDRRKKGPFKYRFPCGCHVVLVDQVLHYFVCRPGCEQQPAFEEEFQKQYPRAATGDATEAERVMGRHVTVDEIWEAIRNHAQRN